QIQAPRKCQRSRTVALISGAHGAHESLATPGKERAPQSHGHTRGPLNGGQHGGTAPKVMVSSTNHAIGAHLKYVPHTAALRITWAPQQRVPNQYSTRVYPGMRV